MSEPIFTRPVLCDHNGNTRKEWYVFFTYTFNGTKYERKLREGINRIKNKKERISYGQGLAAARHEWLKAGWNPITDPKFQKRQIDTIETEAPPMTVTEAFEWALNKKIATVATKSAIDYKSMLQFTKDSAQKLNYHLLPITSFKRFNVLSLLERLCLDKKLSNHAYNKYKGYLFALCRILRQWEVLADNPAEDIPGRQVAESTKYQPLTEEEKKIVAETLQEYNHRYYVCALMTYHTGIRPKEVLALRIKDVHFSTRTIKIIPNAEEENTKTKKSRNVPIDDELLQMLMSLDLHLFPADYYIFGNERDPKYKAGSKGVGPTHPEFFKSSPYRLRRNMVSDIWKEVIIDGKGINKHLYALKHTGADDKIMAGVDMDALRSMYGHGDKQMTEIYAKGIREVYKNEIIKKSPSFVQAKVIKIA